MRGKYIVFEGIDGCGKSSQSNSLTAHLSDQGHETFLTREPGSPHVPFNVRDFILSRNEVDPVALEFLLQADRAAHLTWVKHQLSLGSNVVSDRSFVSGIAYAHTNNLPEELCRDLLTHSVKVFPDHIIYLDVPISEAARRRSKDTPTREEAKGAEFMTKVDQAFKAFFRGELLGEFRQQSKITIIDGTLAREEIFKKVCFALDIPDPTPK